MPGTGQVFTTCVDPVSPPNTWQSTPTRPLPKSGIWWRRRVLPPGPLGLFHKPV